MRVKDTDLAWLACALDAEGCLTLYPQNQNGYSSYRPVIQIVNTNREFIEKSVQILMQLGSNDLKVYRRDARDPDHAVKYRIVYHIQVRGKTVVSAILQALLPWLIVKRNFANDLITFFEDSKARRKSRAKQPLWEIQEAERIRAVHMPNSSSAARANRETPASAAAGEATLCQAEGSAPSTSEGAETRTMSSASDNSSQERPGSDNVVFPPKRLARYKIV